jgi:hypothetical protein
MSSLQVTVLTKTLTRNLSLIKIRRLPGRRRTASERGVEPEKKKTGRLRVGHVFSEEAFAGVASLRGDGHDFSS